MYKRQASYVYESDREKELINAFRTVTDSSIEPTEELDGGRFWGLNEIRANLGKNIFTPNFEYEFINLLNSDVPSKKD